jgi:hypothetical protein
MYVYARTTEGSVSQKLNKTVYLRHAISPVDGDSPWKGSIGCQDAFQKNVQQFNCGSTPTYAYLRTNT